MVFRLMDCTLGFTKSKGGHEMKKYKKLIILLLAILFMFTVACSKSGDPEDATSKPDGETNDQDTDKKDDEDKDDEDKDDGEEEVTIDLKGEPIVIAQWGNAPTDETEAGERTLKRAEELGEKYNTEIIWEALPWAEPGNELVASHLAGEPVADIVLLEYFQFFTMVREGYLLPVDDLFDFNDTKWSPVIRDQIAGSYDGRQYGFHPSVGAATGIYYNRAILEREGLTDPQKLVEQGEWTWDAFLEIAQKTTKDLDGDGKIDQWGLVGHAPTFARQLIYTNEGAIIKEEDGKIISGLEDENTIEALQFVHDLWNTHKVAMPNAHGSFEDYNDSQAVFNDGKATMVSGEIWEGGERGDMEDEYGFVWYPKGPKATDYANVVTNFGMWYMPANAKNPKEAAIIFDELQPWEDIISQDDVIAGLEHSFRTEQDVEMALEMRDKVGVIYVPNEVLFFESVWDITNSGVAPETAIEKIAESFQESLDDALNK